MSAAEPNDILRIFYRVLTPSDSISVVCVHTVGMPATPVAG